MSRPVRTLVAAIVLAALIVAGVAIAVPLIARPILVAAVQDASPFSDQALDVEVDCNVFGLLTGTVDRIHVRGSDLRRGNASRGSLRVGALDVTLVDVATSGGAFRHVSGTLAVIDIPLDDGTSLTVDQVSLDGPSADTTAVATLDHAAAIQLIESALAGGGPDIGDVQLGSGTVAFEVFGTKAEVPIGVENGAIVLVNPFGTGSYAVLTPAAGDPWRFTGVSVTPGGMTIDASVDAGRLLARS